MRFKFLTLNTRRVVECFLRYLEESKVQISRANAEQRLFAKLSDRGFVADIRPLITPAQAEELTDERIKHAFAAVFSKFITILPGETWKKTDEMIERFGLPLEKLGT